MKLFSMTRRHRFARTLAVVLNPCRRRLGNTAARLHAFASSVQVAEGVGSVSCWVWQGCLGWRSVRVVFNGAQQMQQGSGAECNAAAGKGVQLWRLSVRGQALNGERRSQWQGEN